MAVEDSCSDSMSMLCRDADFDIIPHHGSEGSSSDTPSEEQSIRVSKFPEKRVSFGDIHIFMVRRLSEGSEGMDRQYETEGNSHTEEDSDTELALSPMNARATPVVRTSRPRPN